MPRAAPASWVIGSIVALCAMLLLKWLALVAVVAVTLFVFVRWARGGWDRVVPDRDGSEGRPRAGGTIARSAPSVSHPRRSPDHCTWCGLPGGHRDVRGRPVRPRHAHAAP